MARFNKISAGSIVGALVVLPTVAYGHSYEQPVGSIGSTDNTTRIIGGQKVATCNWAATVDVNGCTGSLIHPKVVMSAKHCELGNTTVKFGERSNSAVKQVSASCTDANDGTDWAYCILSEEVTDVPIVPAMFGCEVDMLASMVGKDVVGAGFGKTSANGNDYGTKWWVATPYNGMVGGMIDAGHAQKGWCNGDSGGPVFAHLIDDEGKDQGWRMMGQTSGKGAGGSVCASSTTFSLVWDAIPTIEQDEGIDVTPCFDTDGTWNPGEECTEFPTDPGNAGGTWPACNVGPVTGPITTCGENGDAGDGDAGDGDAGDGDAGDGDTGDGDDDDGDDDDGDDDDDSDDDDSDDDDSDDDGGSDDDGDSDDDESKAEDADDDDKSDDDDDETDDDDAGDGDAGDDDDDGNDTSDQIDDGEEDGCGCSTNVDSDDAPAALAGILLGGLALRRRRDRP
ncbi:MAG: trypsin-like serine protease [Nannocystaceae bacterium]